MQHKQRLMLFVFVTMISFQAFCQTNILSIQNLNDPFQNEGQLLQNNADFPYPPTNFYGDIIGNDVLLNWDAPFTPNWIQWDAGVNNGNGIGLTNGGIFLTASRWEPSELTPFDGMQITKIAYFHQEDNFASFILKVWTGPNAANEILSQAVTGSIINQFNEIELDSPILIDASQELWFGYALSHGIGTNPAGCDDGPAIAYKGDMISMDGVNWVSMSQEYGLDYNWNLAAFLATDDGKQIVLKPMAKSTIKNVDDLLGYNVYRNGEFLAFTTETSYLDEDLLPGTYTYYVTALYDEGESEPSNTFIVIFPESCFPPESVVATATIDDFIEINIIPPDSGNYLGFNLYRDGTLLEMISAGSPAYVDGPMPPGIYEYCVSTVCLDGESETVCDTAQVFIQEYLPPTNLEAYQIGYLYKIKLDWNTPASSDWQSFHIFIKDYSIAPDTFVLHTNTADTSYIHEVFDYGIWEYYVTAVYPQQGESQPSNIAEVYILGEKEIKAPTLKIFPNPATDLTQITSAEKIQSLILYSSFGQAIETKEVNSKSYRMDVGHLPKGIYLLSVQTDEGNYKERLVIY